MNVDQSFAELQNSGIIFKFKGLASKVWVGSKCYLTAQDLIQYLIHHVWNKHAAVNMTVISKKPEYLVFSINQFSYWPVFTRGKKQDKESDHKRMYFSVGAIESILSWNKTQYIAASTICSHFHIDVCTFGRVARTRTFNTITCREGSNKRCFGLKCQQLSLNERTLQVSAVERSVASSSRPSTNQIVTVFLGGSPFLYYCRQIKRLQFSET